MFALNLDLNEDDLRALAPHIERRDMSIEQAILFVLRQGLSDIASSDARLDDLINKHWQVMSDGDIGRLMKPNLPRLAVYRRRMELGFKRDTSGCSVKLAKQFTREVFDGAEFERMVTREGYTMTEYARFKRLTCSRERVRQIAEELGLKHTRADRTIEWQIMRRARRLGNMNLANREWLAGQLTTHKVMESFAVELKIGREDLVFFVQMFGLSHDSFRKPPVETVILTCGACGKPIKRSKQVHSSTLSRKLKRSLNTYCDRKCAGRAKSQHQAPALSR